MFRLAVSEVQLGGFVFVVEESWEELLEVFGSFFTVIETHNFDVLVSLVLQALSVELKGKLGEELVFEEVSPVVAVGHPDSFTNLAPQHLGGIFLAELRDLIGVDGHWDLLLGKFDGSHKTIDARAQNGSIHRLVGNVGAELLAHDEGRAGSESKARTTVAVVMENMFASNLFVLNSNSANPVVLSLGDNLLKVFGAEKRSSQHC